MNVPEFLFFFRFEILQCGDVEKVTKSALTQGRLLFITLAEKKHMMWLGVHVWPQDMVVEIA